MLASKHPVSIKELIESFAENSFAVLFLLLMALPALPLPTGGITHIFEVVVMLLSLELMSGRKTVWLPKQWLNKNLPKSLQTSALPRFIKIIRWAEKYSRPRLSKFLASRTALRFIGLIVFLLTLVAFLAPPFSGLDTLPSLGVLILSLALIFEDILLVFAGIIVGGIGVALVFLLGSLVLRIF